MSKDVTQILSAIDAGDRGAAEQLLPLVYDELRRLAAAKMSREAPGQTLQATALVHEAYLNLIRPQHTAADVANGMQRFDGRAHFFAAASEAMRRILIGRARARSTDKRGGGRTRVELKPDMLFTEEAADTLVDLDEALKQLAEVDPQKSKLVELRFFGGLSLPQAAEVLGMSKSSAERLWAVARAWLYKELRGEQWHSPES